MYDYISVDKPSWERIGITIPLLTGTKFLFACTVLILVTDKFTEAAGLVSPLIVVREKAAGLAVSPPTI